MSSSSCSDMAVLQTAAEKLGNGDPERVQSEEDMRLERIVCKAS